MKLIKKLGLIIAAIAFCISISAATSYAQPGRAGWKNNNGKHKGWTKGQRNGWDNGRKTGWRNRSILISQQDRIRRTGRITPQEYRQMQRKRLQLNRTRTRYYNDGYISDKERRKLQKRYNKYQRRVSRDTRD